MALYSLTSSLVQRSQGRSAVASAAYRAGQRIRDEVQGLVFDYTRKEEVVLEEIHAPESAKGVFANRSELWNAVERANRRKDSQTAREVRISLPKELNYSQQVALARDFVRETFVSEGRFADLAIHRKAGNPHAHILLTVNKAGPDGFGKKLACDGAMAWLGRVKKLKAMRAEWARFANLALERAGRSERIDHRSYQERGIQLEPQTKHYGKQEKIDEHQRIAHDNGVAILKNPLVALDAISKSKPVFQRKDLEELLTRQTLGREQFEQALDTVMASPEIVRLGRGVSGVQLYTTKTMRAAERSVVELASELSGKRTAEVSPSHFRAAVSSRTLSDEQRLALYHVLSAGDLAVVEGYAGAGKSYMLGAAREAWAKGGRRVLGAAISGKAAEGLQTGAGIASRSITGWETLWEKSKSERHQLRKGDVLVVDEAGMVGSEQMERLLLRARRVGAKVVLVGDTEQIPAIDAGEPMRVIREQVGAAWMVDIRRQKFAWQRKASVDFAQGRVQSALSAYRQRGDIRAAKSSEEAIARLVADWDADRRRFQEGAEAAELESGDRIAFKARVGSLGVKAGEHGLVVSASAKCLKVRLDSGKVVEFDPREVKGWHLPPQGQLMLAFRRAEVRALNDGAREYRIANGELGKGLRFGTSDGSRELASADRICFLKNDRGLGVMNGSLGVVKSVSSTRVAVRLDSGAAVAFDPRKYQDWDHGYATTVHKSQGVTVDRVYVLASRFFNRALGYVAMSRQRHSCRLYYSEREFLGLQSVVAQFSRSVHRPSALDVVDVEEQNREIWRSLGQGELRRPVLDKVRSRPSEGLRGSALEGWLQADNPFRKVSPQQFLRDVRTARERLKKLEPVEIRDELLRLESVASARTAMEDARRAYSEASRLRQDDEWRRPLLSVFSSELRAKEASAVERLEAAEERFREAWESLDNRQEAARTCREVNEEYYHWAERVEARRAWVELARDARQEGLFDLAGSLESSLHAKRKELLDREAVHAKSGPGPVPDALQKLRREFRSIDREFGRAAFTLDRIHGADEREPAARMEPSPRAQAELAAAELSVLQAEATWEAFKASTGPDSIAQARKGQGAGAEHWETLMAVRAQRQVAAQAVIEQKSIEKQARIAAVSDKLTSAERDLAQKRELQTFLEAQGPGSRHSSAELHKARKAVLLVDREIGKMQWRLDRELGRTQPEKEVIQSAPGDGSSYEARLLQAEERLAGALRAWSEFTGSRTSEEVLAARAGAGRAAETKHPEGAQLHEEYRKAREAQRAALRSMLEERRALKAERAGQGAAANDARTFRRQNYEPSAAWRSEENPYRAQHPREFLRQRAEQDHLLRREAATPAERTRQDAARKALEASEPWRALAKDEDRQQRRWDGRQIRMEREHERPGRERDGGRGGAGR